VLDQEIVETEFSFYLQAYILKVPVLLETIDQRYLDKTQIVLSTYFFKITELLKHYHSLFGHVNLLCDKALAGNILSYSMSILERERISAEMMVNLMMLILLPSSD
jgi:hypothetical protein